MPDLRELARLAVEATRDGDVGPQIVFLEALAKAVAAAGDFTSPGRISSSPRVTLLNDGRLSADRPLASILAQNPPVLTLGLIAARLVAFAPAEPNVREAALIVNPGSGRG
ncbi:MAG: hypothetical protein M3O46_23035 [Myxococcota bacterium]|nr:hypothetical protein [Myxococcota bacterium]